MLTKQSYGALKCSEKHCMYSTCSNFPHSVFSSFGKKRKKKKKKKKEIQHFVIWFKHILFRINEDGVGPQVLTT